MAFRLAEDTPEELHEINVTPFIDVMLVLLIIFMVAAPLATVDLPVDLPAASAAPQPRPEQPVFLTLRADLSLHLDEAPVAREALPAALAQRLGEDQGQRVFLRADQAVPYGAVMAMLETLRLAGWTQVALVAEEAGAR